jgi:L-methionine (R)-S-oxide reductase
MNPNQPLLNPAWSHKPSTLEQWNSVLDKILHFSSCKTGTIHRLDPATGFLSLVAHAGIPAELMDKVANIPVGKGIAGAAAQKREAVQFCNIQNDPTGVVRPDARKTNVQGALAVPVLREGRLVGVLGVGKLEPHDFTEQEIADVRGSADMLADWLA